MSPESKHLLLCCIGKGREARVEELLGRAGHQLTAVTGIEPCVAELGRRDFDAVLLAAPGDSLGASLGEIKQHAPRTPVLALVDAGDVRAGVKCLQQGAEDYLLRPPDAYELRMRLDRILERAELDSRVRFLQEEITKKPGLREADARSPAMRGVLDRVMRAAPMRSTVLIQGESGVGKELVARSIHFNSPRRNGPFIALNCAAIPGALIESELFGHEKGAFTGAHGRMRGKFEIAHRGTLFLDEIGEMLPATQVKLLRVLEERDFMRIGGDRNIRVDVRVVAATNANLEKLVEEGRFRSDLYYRLKVVTIRVPPLRERRGDMPFLIEAFLAELARANAVDPKTISPEALSALTDYGWPGNVRELKNLLESLLVSVAGPVIRIEDLPAHIHRLPARVESAAAWTGMRLADMERDLIRRTLEQTGGNRTHSASVLGIGVRTLQRKIRGYALDVPPRRRRPRARVLRSGTSG
jgi:DNA-binding NtrC family response regulator